MDEIRNDLRFGVRLLAKAPAFAATAILTLALGIGANTAILTAAGWVLLRPLPYEAPDRLVMVGEGTLASRAGTVGYLTIADWRDRARTLSDLVAIRGWDPTLVAPEGAERLEGLGVSWNYFRMLGVRPALGRDFEANDDHPDRWRVVILSDGLWRRRFGGRPEVIGTSIVFNGRNFQVVGVLPRDFEPLISARYHGAAEIWSPLGYGPAGSSACRTCRHLRAVGRLAPNVTIDQATAELRSIHTILRRDHPTDYGDRMPELAPLQQALTGTFRRPLLVLLGAVGFVLFIACANVAGLLVARAAGRAREMTVRAALGASRQRIVRQLLTESVVIAIAGTLAGLAVAKGSLALLASYLPAGLPRVDHTQSDATLALVAAAVGAGALALFGLLPAFDTAKTDLQAVLRTARHTTRRGTARLREAMIVVQVAVALVLVTGGGLMYRTMDRLLAVDPGFDARGVLTAGFSLVGPAWAEDSAVYMFQQRLIERVARLPGVEAVGVSGQVPLGRNYDRRGLFAEGVTYATPDDVPSAERYSVTPGYFDALRISHRRGRLITDRDRADSEPVVLINETAARLVWPDVDPIGRRLRLTETGAWRTVVGVVADVRHDDLASVPTPQLYLPQSQFTDSFVVLVVRASGDAAPLMTAIRRDVAALAPDVPLYDVNTLEDLIASSVASRRFLMLVLGLFAAVALALSSLGVYGVVAEAVASREREVGIRVSLGARRSAIAALMLRQGTVLVGVGLAAGAIVSFGVTRLLENQLYETSTTDPVTFLAAALSLIVIALLAHVLPLRRAMRVDPGIVLRAD